MKLEKFMMLVTVLLAFFMKVKSVLYSEMRNKLGGQVVGSGWKGRMTLRAYKIPANPNSLAQQAHRTHQANLVARWQAQMEGDAAAKLAWNTDALPRAISGYNLFTKLGRSSNVQCDATQTSPNDIEGTYTVKSDISSAGLYVLKPDTTTFEEVVAVGAMTEGDDVPFSHPADANGLWQFWIVDGRSKTIPPVDGDRMALYNRWWPDTSTGNATPAHCVYSGV